MSLPAALVFFVALALLVAGGLAGPTAWVVLRRARAMRRPFPAAWREVLRRRMPLYAELSAATQRRLEQRVQVLLAELPFIGCGGLVVSAEMRVLIAAQAALLLLERGGGFGTLRQVLLYPGAFVVDRAEPGAGGVVHEARRALAGESWQQGQVVLAWDAVQAGAAEPHDGANVVIHEFAHQLDLETGGANGAPFLGGAARSARRSNQQRWARVMNAEYRVLQARLARGETGLIDAYAAGAPAEFFAVVSELFFERPEALAEAHPELFDEMRRCYRLDPRRW
ncbi:MAG: M90 family metallopeptidase [Rubrivivax sp.]